MEAEKVNTRVDLSRFVQRVEEEAVAYCSEEGPKADINWPRLATGGPQEITRVAGLVIDAAVTRQLTLEGRRKDILRQAVIRNPEAAANALADLLNHQRVAS